MELKPIMLEVLWDFQNKQWESMCIRIIPVSTNHFRKRQTTEVNTAPGTDEATEALWILLEQEQEEKESLREAWGKTGEIGAELKKKC